jgi:hypothetical protein
VGGDWIHLAKGGGVQVRFSAVQGLGVLTLTVDMLPLVLLLAFPAGRHMPGAIAAARCLVVGEPPLAAMTP